MKKLALFLGLAGLSFGNVCDFDLKEHLPSMPPEVKVESKREVMPGLCEIVLSHTMGELIVYGNERYVIVGNLISRGKNLTEERMAELFKERFKEVRKELENLVAATAGKPKKDGMFFYFISDPDCPYCQSVKRQVRDLALEKGWQIKVIWFPLPFHQGADKKAESFICEKKTYEDYLKDNWGSKSCEEGREKVKKALELMAKLKVGGTPAFIFPDGDMVVGANLNALEAKMEEKRLEDKEPR